MEIFLRFNGQVNGARYPPLTGDGLASGTECNCTAKVNPEKAQGCWLWRVLSCAEALGIQLPSFRGDAKHRTRNLEIPRCALRI
jgi:hypothetical protein